MATPTDPTVPSPIPTDLDDTDDDDDDLVSTTAPAPPPPAATSLPPEAQPIPQPPATVAPAPPPAAATTIVPDPASPIPNTLSQAPSPSTTQPLADSLPTDLTSTSAPQPPLSSNKPLSPGAAAGIGVGTTLFLLLLILFGYFFLRRRKQRRARRSRSASDDATLRGSVTPSDEESARKGAEVYAYRRGAHEMGDEGGGGVAKEMSGVGAGGGDEADATRRRSELASPVTRVEVDGDREFPVELPGCDVLGPGAKGGGEGERLFDDEPVDEREIPGDEEVPGPRFVEKKG